MKAESRSLKFILLPLVFLGISATNLFAQDNLMAEGNMQFALHYGFFNRSGINIPASLDAVQWEEQGNLNTLDYTVNVARPISLTYEYAISDFTAIGATLSYHSFKLTENRIDPVDNYSIETKGSQIKFLVRGLRYLTAKPKRTAYLFLDGGINIRSINSTANNYQKEVAFIHQYRLTSFAKRSPLYFDLGIGAKYLLAKNIGFSIEAGFIESFVRAGIFYNLKHKDRRVYDKYGW